MRPHALVDEARRHAVNGNAAQAGSLLAGLLASHFELRIDVDDVLERLPTTVLDEASVLWRALALNELERGRYVEADEAARRAQELAKPPEVADCLLDRALIARDRTDWDTSVRFLDEAETLALSDPQRLRLLNSRAVVELAHRFDLDRARAYLREVEVIAAKVGDRTALLTAVINRGLGPERIQGRFDAMIDCARQIDRHYAGEVPVEDQVYRLRLIAEAKVHLAHDDAISYCRQLIELGHTFSNAQALGYGYALASFAWLGQGNAEAANESAEACRALALPFNAAVYQATLAEVALAQRLGRNAEAQKALDDLLSSDLPLDRRLEALVMQMRVSPALETLAEGLNLADRLGSDWGRVQLAVLGTSLEFIPAQAQATMKLIQEQGLGGAIGRSMRESFALFLGRCLQAGIEVSAVQEQLSLLDVEFLVVKLVGELRVAVRGGVVEAKGWTRPKARVLFAYLAASLPNPVPTEQVLDDLWPDAGPDEARNSLRVAASYVRRALCMDMIKSDGRFVKRVLPTCTRIDVVELRRATRSPDPKVWRRALAEVSDGLPLADIADLWVLPFRDEIEALKSRLEAKLRTTE